MPTRRAGGRRLHRLDQRHDRLGAQEQAEARRDGHRMLDGRQREGRIARRRFRQAVQSLPAHEAHHAAEDSRQPRLHERGSRDRYPDRRKGAAFGRAHDPAEELTAKGRCVTLLCPDAFLSPLEIDAAVTRALAEDLGRAGDVTSIATVPEGTRGRAVVVARKGGTIAGLPLVEAALRKLDPAASITAHHHDGDAVAAKAKLLTIEADARALLASERTALNFLGHLSGIATATAAFVKLIAHSKARVCCTRKTTPGMRALQKYAVRCGGGFNHRFGLDDAILIKDNHIAVAGGITAVLARAKAVAGHLVKIEIEVDTLDQLREVLAAGGADVALLDNMSTAEMRQAVEMVAGRLVLEASGGITLETAAAVAETGVDYLSSGAITHTAPNLDVAVDIEM